MINKDIFGKEIKPEKKKDLEIIDMQYFYSNPNWIFEDIDYKDYIRILKP